MSYNSPIQAISSNTLTFANPSNVTTSPPALSVQIQNNSPYTLTNNLNSTTIHPSSLLTIPISLGQGPLILTVVNYTAPVGVLGCQWLEDGENPDQPDGPVTTNPVPAPFSVLASGNAASATVNPSPVARGLLILCSGAVVIESILLTASGTIVQLVNQALGSNGYVWVPLTGAGGPLFAGTNGVSVLINFQTACAYIVYEVDSEIPPLPLVPGAAAELQSLIAALLVANTITEVSPGAGVDWTYTTTNNLRLKQVHAQFVAGVAVANRVPLLRISTDTVNFSQYPMVASPILAGVTEILTGSPQTPLDATVASAVGTTYATYPFMDVLLPSGSIIQAQTAGLQGADQWSNIFFVFTPN